VYRDYEARNGTKHHERRRLTNAGERSGREGDGGGGDGDGRSDTVVVVGSRYADTFAGCERPGQRRVNWRGVPSRDSHHDRRTAEGVFSRVYRYSVYRYSISRRRSLGIRARRCSKSCAGCA